MRATMWRAMCLAGMLGAFSGCSSGDQGRITGDDGPPPPPQQGNGPRLGTPLDGLDAATLARFDAGRDAFLEVEGAPKLGPIFNGRSCAECHSQGAPGGGGVQNVTRFGRVDATGAFDPLANLGGSLLQRFAVPGVPPEMVPPEANVTALRQTTPVFGAGLIEAIPDAQIRAVEADQKARFPDLAGRACAVTEGSDGQAHVGRFGWKAQHALILDFSADAYDNEMGVTSSLAPLENRPHAAPVAVAAVEDVNDEDTLAFADFMRLVAAPHRRRIDDQVRAGEALFSTLQCAVCHKPEGYVAASGISAINGQTVRAYSDFLLHDVGTGDGITQGDAGPDELRTPPLWGLRASAPYLHDGSAATVEQAILEHRGQAATARAGYQALSAADKDALLRFLGSL